MSNQKKNEIKRNNEKDLRELVEYKVNINTFNIFYYSQFQNYEIIGY